MSLTDRIKAGPATHKHQHGGWQTQARRRGEEWVGCNTYGDNPAVRAAAVRLRHHSDEQPETWWDVLKSLAVFALCIGAIYSVAILLAASAMGPVGS